MKKLRFRPYFYALTSMLLVSKFTYAARPMITDDARMVDAKSCQVESWVKNNKNSTEFWALPACNFGGNLELTLGGAKGKDNEGLHTTDFVVQAKTILKPLQSNDWGMAFVIGNVTHPAIRTDSNLLGDIYAYIPMSFSFKDDKFVLHTNLGGLHQKEAQIKRLTWGIGTETYLTEKVWLIGETFGQNQGKPFFQFGIRYWISPNQLQIDTTYGDRFKQYGYNERWVSIGLRWLSVPFLP